jgi:CheY-like chemotaxis protein/nitrogen-specific signal transduction histidine kinase
MSKSPTKTNRRRRRRPAQKHQPITTSPTAVYQEILGHLTLRITHDFNNSLTSILGNSEIVQDTLSALAKKDASGTEAENALPVIDDVIRKCLEMATFIKKLQDYARQQPRTKETLHINHTIKELLPIAQKLLGRKIVLEFLPSEGLPELFGESTNIDQILFSLLLNSKETMPSGGTVTIRTETTILDTEYTDSHPGALPGTYVQLTLTDTGQGISPDALPQSFELFSNPHDGSLRLPTVYAIVKQLSGYINVTRRPGKGTCYEIYLPIQLAKPRPPIAAKALTSKRRPGPKARKALRKAKQKTPLILIAEDQDDVRITIERAILKAGYKTASANNGNVAFTLFEELTKEGNKPRLVIADLGLPGIDGRTLCKKIRTAHSKTALLLTTGHQIDLKDNNTRTAEDDFNFIQKPFEPAMLISTIQRILNNNG